MKVLVSIFAICFVGVLGNIAEPDSNHRENLKQCVEESGVDQTAVDKLQDKVWEIDNKKLKCFSKCMMIKIGAINNDGTLNEENIKKKMSHEFPEGKADEVMKKCKDPKGADACENSLLMLKCFFDNTAFTMHKDN